MTDPGQLDAQYGTDERLQVRIDTHRHYGVGDRDIFAVITASLLERGPVPTAVLDVGAGTGAWYRAIRRIIPASPEYVGLDRSAGILDRLRQETANDQHAHVLLGDAERLPFEDHRFDWVGCHFVLYHVPDIRQALSQAWRVLRPGGLLACATNGAYAYREFIDIGEEVRRALGLGPTALASVSHRFSLENGAEFFPEVPERIRRSGGFLFPSAEPAVRYLDSGPLRHHLGDAGQDEALYARALDLARDAIAARIRANGPFRVHSDGGFFVARKNPLTGS